jgi:hypothetical protein
MMKPSSRGLKWIYGTHDLKLRRESYDILKILSAKLEASDRIRPPVICEITPSCKINNEGIDDYDIGED